MSGIYGTRMAQRKTDLDNIEEANQKGLRVLFIYVMLEMFRNYWGKFIITLLVITAILLLAPFQFNFRIAGYRITKSKVIIEKIK